MLRQSVFTVIVFFTSVAVQPLHAIDVGLEFNSLEQQSRYHRLIDELRCLVCQNQNVADSNAGLAQDLRNRTYQMIVSGQTDQHILDYMTERYGDFVLYRPPLNPLTLFLWFGPVIFLTAVAISFWIYFRRSKNRSTSRLSSEERQKAWRLLDQ